MQRVGIAGFLHESNSFSPIPTPYQHFKDTSLTRGEALLERWQGTHHQLGGFLEGAREFQFEPVPLLATYGVPSAPLPSDSFEELAADLTRSLRAALPLDGLLVAPARGCGGRELSRRRRRARRPLPPGPGDPGSHPGRDRPACQHLRQDGPQHQRHRGSTGPTPTWTRERAAGRQPA